MENKLELLKKVYQVISETAQISGRTVSDIKLVAVSKKKSAKNIEEMRRCGVRDFGENYVQEFLEKHETLQDLDINWHFIGTLQRNKVKYIIDKVCMIHTVDSIKLAKEISKEAAKKNIHKIKVLLQVNIGREPQKGGFMPEEIFDAYKEISVMEKIEICGLMSIPPFLSSEELRPYHRDLSRLFFDVINKCSADRSKFKELSMGMSEDFDTAIEEGATIIRLGTILFGKRD
jgi:PLP dependent protein